MSALLSKNTFLTIISFFKSFPTFLSKQLKAIAHSLAPVKPVKHIFFYRIPRFSFESNLLGILPLAVIHMLTHTIAILIENYMRTNYRDFVIYFLHKCIAKSAYLSQAKLSFKFCKLVLTVRKYSKLQIRKTDGAYAIVSLANFLITK